MPFFCGQAPPFKYVITCLIHHTHHVHVHIIKQLHSSPEQNYGVLTQTKGIIELKLSLAVPISRLIFFCNGHCEGFHRIIYHSWPCSYIFSEGKFSLDSLFLNLCLDKASQDYLVWCCLCMLYWSWTLDKPIVQSLAGASHCHLDHHPLYQ